MSLVQFVCSSRIWLLLGFLKHFKRLDKTVPQLSSSDRAASEMAGCAESDFYRAARVWDQNAPGQFNWTAPFMVP